MVMGGVDASHPGRFHAISCIASNMLVNPEREHVTERARTGKERHGAREHDEPTGQ
jgi:hypothetical protein